MSRFCGRRRFLDCTGIFIDWTLLSTDLQKKCLLDSNWYSLINLGYLRKEWQFDLRRHWEYTVSVLIVHFRQGNDYCVSVYGEPCIFMIDFILLLWDVHT